MGKDKSIERRYPRIRSEIIISLEPVEASRGKEILTTSKTLGLGGLMFESEKKMTAGENLEMSLLAGIDLIRTTVRVVWAEKSEGGKWTVGIEFLDIDEEDRTRLLDYLMRRVYLEEEEGFNEASRP